MAKSALTSAWLLRHPLFVRPGHYYSPVTGPEDVRRAGEQRADLARLDGVQLDADAQRYLAGQLAPEWPKSPAIWNRYRPDNTMFGLADGIVYQSLLSHLGSRRVIEIGSGFSSALALDVRDSHLPDLDLTFVEPYPDRLLGLLTERDRDRAQLIQQPLQSVPLDIYRSLGRDDILFVDSTHVAKAGSDVNWLLFQILPILAEGVVIHIHDIFFPFEYADSWLAEHRSWNESYLLRAFLSYNDTFRIMLFNSWLWQDQKPLIEQYLPEASSQQPGSIWIRKIA
jgi:hypothetical protein